MAAYDFSGIYIGTVLKVDVEKRRVGAYIPRLMAAMFGNEENQYQVPTNNGLSGVSFSTNMNKVVTKSNYIWLKSWFYKQPLPNIGSKIQAIFIDGNIAEGFWRTFDPNGDYEALPEEAHVPQFKLNINGIEENVYSDSTVNINLPPYFDIVKTLDENKNLNITFNENYNFYKGNSLIEAVNNLQKSVEFLQNQTVESYVSSLSSIQSSIVSPSTELNKSLKTVFDNYKFNVLNNINTLENIYDINDCYIVGSNVLNLLNTSYSNYNNYLSLFTQLSAENLKKLPQNINSQYINNQISELYNKLTQLNKDNKNVLSDYQKIYENYFPTVCIIDIYYNELSTNNQLLSKVITIEYSPFELFSDKNGMTIPDNPASKYAFTDFDSWYDGDYYYNKNESLIFLSRKLVPSFFGFDVDGNNHLQLIVSNRYPNYNISCKYKKLSTDDETTENNITLDYANSLIDNMGSYAELTIILRSDENVAPAHTIEVNIKDQFQ